MQHPEFNKALTRHRKSETDFWGYEYHRDALMCVSIKNIKHFPLAYFMSFMNLFAYFFVLGF